MKRKAPMKRGKPMKRNKRLGLGKKTLAKRAAIHAAITTYFMVYGWRDDEGPCAFDQVTGRFLRIENATAHHKVPRSELRKAGVLDLDAPHRLIIMNKRVHIAWVHDMQMGRPKGTDERLICIDNPLGFTEAARRFQIVQHSEANASNGLAVKWSDQDRLDLDRFLGGE